ncbi:hypothetical protein JCM21714_3745 [Gracilibacillus boraciitolerans JCM 21714]|uniref:Uncharacterized protein n=1 Tax=Gracilibacillus boraciitolerans JCM 21714 TaxID=1298598 RepID=W4VPA0_9BACI|nr:glycosyl hydrolase family 8 [Gracilibacillus boraciitolerans]GAE94574.1 hypothetical protein JCM21714_3745 [Gracilibacillus boraciitolerans JCM 21714]
MIVSIILFSKNHRFSTESFIEKWFVNQNDTLATYVLEGEQEDDDLVKGREALSESLGLWMMYAVEKQDAALFGKAYSILQKSFLDKDGFIPWKLTEAGTIEVVTNALVDDLRIIEALYQAEALWEGKNYAHTANLIASYLFEHNRKEHLLTDFYDHHYQVTSDVITLSYINPDALKDMYERKLLNSETYDNMLVVLTDADVKNGFYPKSYHIGNQQYFYDRQVI